MAVSCWGNTEAEKGVSFYLLVSGTSFLTKTRESNIFYCCCTIQSKNTSLGQSFIKTLLCISPARTPALATKRLSSALVPSQP